jgi:hypothetical protein
VTDSHDTGPQSDGAVGLSLNTQWLWIVACVVFALAIGAFMIGPLRLVASPAVGVLDPSWQLAMGAALADHLRFGPQYLFTYGPLGFMHESLQYPTAVLTDLAMAATVASATTYTLAFLLLAEAVRRITGRSGTQAGLIFLGAILAAYWSGAIAGPGTRAVIISLAALALCWLAPRSRLVPWLGAAAGVLLGFAAMYKVDFQFVAVGELALLTGLALGTREGPRRALIWAWAGAVLSYLAIWLIAGQRLTDLPSFWTGSWQISAGYSAAMSVAAHWKTLAAAALVAMVGIALPLVVEPWRSRRLSAQAATVIISLPWLYVNWKDGMVRQGGLAGDNVRVLALFAGILAVAWLVVVVSPRLLSWRTVPPLLGAVVCVGVSVYGFGWIEGPRWIVTVLQPQPATAASTAGIVPSSITATLRGHTVTALPWDDAYVIESHLRWDTLPEPQTYSAYTPYLDHLDANQLASSQGAQRLVITLEDIDARYLFWDPPAVWDTVISRYTCGRTFQNSVVLVRRPPVVGAPSLLGSASGRMGTWIPVPRTTAAYEFASVQIGSSLEGRILNVALRQTAVMAMLQLSNGEVVGPVRVIAATAGDGLYLSHYLGSTSALCQVLAGTATGVPAITAIQFLSSHPSEWDPTVTLRFTAAQ